MPEFAELKSLEGRRVGIALTDGSRMDDCELVSTARGELRTLWLFSNGMDVFVPLAAVIEVWEVGPSTAVDPIRAA